MCNRPGASARSWQRISHTPSCSRLRNNAGHEGSLGIPCTGAMALHSPPRRVATAPLRVTVKPEIFDLGWFVLQGYGLMIALGIVSACLVIPREARRLGLTGLHENFVEILVAMVTAAFLGGKLWFVLGDMPAARAIVERGGFAAILPEVNPRCFSEAAGGCAEFKAMLLSYGQSAPEAKRECQRFELVAE